MRITTGGDDAPLVRKADANACKSRAKRRGLCVLGDGVLGDGASTARDVVGVRFLRLNPPGAAGPRADPVAGPQAAAKKFRSNVQLAVTHRRGHTPSDDDDDGDSDTLPPPRPNRPAARYPFVC